MQRKISSNKGRLLRKGASAVYHVIGRTVRKQFWFGEREKAVFINQMHKQAAFAGVEVLTYCLMDNHFHMLVRVPPCPWAENGKHALSDADLLDRYSVYYGEEIPQSTYSLEELRLILAGGGEAAEEARRTVMARMGNLPAFMRELKQRFVFWFNREHRNEGTIWSARYRSVLVEDRLSLLTRVAGYIDLNPVRAAVVKDSRQYGWCGYGAAVAGDRRARDGFLGLYREELVSRYSECLRAYRLILAGRGISGNEEVVGEQAVSERLQRGERVSDGELLRCRLRSFSRGRIIGGQEFVRECMGEDLSRSTKLRKMGIVLLEGLLEGVAAGMSYGRDWRRAFV